MKSVNSYNIYNPKNYVCVLWHALASDENEVRQLAKDAGIDLDGLEIELIRTDVRDQLRRPYSPRIEDAQVY